MASEKDTKWTPGPWKADVRSGCLAVYPADEEHTCLSGAESWAIHYSARGAEFMAGPGDQGGHWTMDEQAQHDARLIAAAPRIYNALAAVEWGGRGFVDYEINYAACPACGGYDPSDLAEGNYYYEENKDYIGHRDDCQLAAALAQAREKDA